MKKYNINGTVMVKVSSVNYTIRKIRKYINDFVEDESIKKGMEKSLDMFLRYLYRDELRVACSFEEIEDILQTTGDFVVCRMNPDTEKMEAFLRWEDGKAVIGSINECMFFDYESVANSVCNKMNESYGTGWKVEDMCEDSAEDTKRLLEAIFDGLTDEL